MSRLTVRDNNWLISRLDQIWSKHFCDVEKSNPLFIHFGRYSKYRLGSIRLKKKSDKSYIIVTGMFKKLTIPVEVVDHTLAHELVHYTHGFSSKRVRLHKYPHVGGIVQKEMKKRGMGYLIDPYRIWIKEYKKQLLDDR